MKKTLPLSFTFLLVACGSNPNKVVAVKAGEDVYKTDMAAAHAIKTNNKDKVVCETRRKTGSHFKEKICTTVSQKEREREDAKRTMEQNRTLSAKRVTQGRGG